MSCLRTVGKNQSARVWMCGRIVYMANPAGRPGAKRPYNAPMSLTHPQVRSRSSCENDNTACRHVVPEWGART